MFAEVAKQGSFTAAAKELGVSKSAVSQQIQILETELKVQLLSRTTRGLTLTAMGKKMASRCQTIRNQVDAAFIEIENAQDYPTGPFTVTYPYSIETNVVMPAIEQLVLEYPGVEPDLKPCDTQIDLVTNNVDVAIRGGKLEDSGYRALPLTHLTEIFCATPLYLQRCGLSPNDFDELALGEHPWISSSWQRPAMEFINHRTKKTFTLKLKEFAKTNSLPCALNLAIRNIGIVLLPEVAVRGHLLSSELVRIATDITGPLWPIHMVHTYQADKPVHVMRFYELAKQLITTQSHDSSWIFEKQKFMP